MKRTIALCLLLILIGWALTLRFGGSEEAQAEPTAESLNGADPSSVASGSSETPRAVVAVKSAVTGSTVFRILNTADGATIKDLPGVQGVFSGDYPELSSDGKWVYFTAGAPDAILDIRRQSVDDGHLEVIVSNGQQPALNPRGDYLAFGRGGVLVVRKLSTKADYVVGDAKLPEYAKGNVLAGLRSLAWISNERVAALVSSDFQQFRIVVASVGVNEVSVDTVRDAPRGQVVGRADSVDEVTVVDDMTNGLIVHNVVLRGPASISQRFVAQSKATVWDVTNDGRQILISDGKELRRQDVDDANQKAALSADAFSAGF